MILPSRPDVIARRRAALELSEEAQAAASNLRDWVDRVIAEGGDPADGAAALADAAGYATGLCGLGQYEAAHRRAQRAYDRRRLDTVRRCR